MHVGRWPKIFGVAIALGFLALWFGWHQGTSVEAQDGGTGSNAQPADKIAVSGASFQVLGTPVTDGAKSEVRELLRGSIKTSSPTDLIFSLNLECALWTDVTVIGNDESQAIATVKAWIEIDGKPVRVSADDTAEPGKVVFCNRAYKVAISDLDDEDAKFDHFLRTRSANGFEWLTLNVGSGTHSIVVKGQLDAQVTGMGQAQAGIGKRTLVVEPVKLANNASI
jgi:hypothetical protein